jgi:hypothetical protein
MDRINPSNHCQFCYVQGSQTAWSDVAQTQLNGTKCGSGQVCHAGICQAGCSMNYTYYAPGAFNPAFSPGQCNSACNPAVSTDSWGDAPAGTPCVRVGPGGVGVADVCYYGGGSCGQGS